MRILAIDSATEACSVALFDGDTLIAGQCEVIGRGHAERLVPMIADLPGQGRADRILVSMGPGSFTGVRIGLAAARALGLAWQAEVLGFPTLCLVAAMVQQQSQGPVSICMTGGHGEWFVQNFAADGFPRGELLSRPPAEAAEATVHETVAGSQSGALIARRGHGRALSVLPDARHAMRLSGELLSRRLSPIYGRAPDARVPERAV
ncbi:tRNA (adenosine(37)-N6)-threonylcarbamoyltransferase complex dimerization subunit type 1 TsaB [Altererythrobacter xixiisoli]|uniref:tRNA (Adenosine(37)-N6)-threonylcarbamoyltransferase complex dimerization subunit type 1 TsaB n=1 Tax=Croceibacterium xixiisoli TaxID=1476466 RepID=A0A6I4TWV5_9SPHN|nr:tRNA (adenosine(37)-N6)-threonylcarbamoyltransferase complex dimerization subunit type 1 TsaB [Croceibacterium xixiisoli]MXO99720.1 tRNA (adenosine(37)-N6)-threonylcarbamoyltransferase complex dimerization subunit type 1 TsaB [Croceibacterium xixiisoli]